jgi:Tfp pilus assembly protein PilV
MHLVRPRSRSGFALYEVMLGVMVFVIGVLALGHSVENCINASSISAEEDRVRQILANRMAEIQTTPGTPEASKKNTVDSGYGDVEIIQKVVPAGLKEADDTELSGISTVTITAHWKRSGTEQSRSIEFYVYRQG